MSLNAGDNHHHPSDLDDSTEKCAVDKSEVLDNRVAGSEDSSLQIPSSTGHEEETALEDVLIITTDKSLESLVDDMAPADEGADLDRQKTQLKKERSKEKEDKVKPSFSVE